MPTLQYADLPLLSRAPDKKLGISNASGRAVYDGHRAVVVKPDSSSKTQIAALLDLLDLHLLGADVGEPVAADRVSLLVQDPKPEALGALQTLVASIADRVTVDILQLVDGAWQPARIRWDPADPSTHKGWDKLLGAVQNPPPLVRDIIGGVGLDSLRAYPRLSTKGGWSLRLEGLEVAQVTAKGGTLGVGRDGAPDETGKPAQSKPRQCWIEATGFTEIVFLTDDQASRRRAVSAILDFAEDWLRDVRDAKPEQNEHALESRILRGAAGVDVGGKTLGLVLEDPHINWGSQFPTKWGPGGRARYLDAVLRDGSTPWAIEMKVRGTGGVSQYYRHAVAQTVLYREFIKAAEDLHFWFERFGLDPHQCQAAVVVPTMTDQETHWRDRLQNLCDLFEVALCEVDPVHATLP